MKLSRSSSSRSAWSTLSAFLLAATASTPLFGALTDDAQVQAALSFITTNEPAVIEEQIRLCEIPAPPFQETERAHYYAGKFEEYGLQDVHIDEEGNVFGTRPGTNPDLLLVFSAHLDTVFPAGTDVTVKREGNILRAPGISDDCRGLAVVLGVLQALNDQEIQTDGTILFMGTVGEEGLGDLRGVRHLFESDKADSIDYFISMDGTGLHATTGAVGSHRYEVTFSSAGGHSYGAFGQVNPIHALGRAIAKISDFEMAAEPKATFNVGMISGGTSVNSIARTASFQIDMRSPSATSLDNTDAMFRAAVAEAVAEENEFWKTHAHSPTARNMNAANPVVVDIKQVGLRPTGDVPPDSPIIACVSRANAALEVADRFGSSSTDSNIAISLGVPAVTLGGGGRGAAAHSLDELFETTDSHLGTQRALLTVLEIVGLAK
ncbi:M20/M25/M40 family metallo-hydrolase [Actomonas aquatica]|uniref:M20/M25/M40 family metallo-hydrolase n=1 Tax=Actomonas aquatica TaxID=2866162 RepID=A0ABZ1C422_9BACT|nr:M20/M25/M40 family metallo-hydrolase [Opitutus sp. WL0086]WRQ86043.1 M20/M25/M40 family metallo-hydrolase [Opitutus sp. WL0086]